MLEEVNKDSIQLISDAEEAFKVIQPIYLSKLKSDQGKEHFWVLGLGLYNDLMYVELISLGTSNSAPVEMKQVFQRVLVEKVSKIIIVHNHPSGVLVPSDADEYITDKVDEACDVFDIELVDHLIISQNDFFSLRDNGLMM